MVHRHYFKQLFDVFVHGESSTRNFSNREDDWMCYCMYIYPEVPLGFSEVVLKVLLLLDKQTIPQ